MRIESLPKLSNGAIFDDLARVTPTSDFKLLFNVKELVNGIQSYPTYNGRQIMSGI